MLSLLSYKAEVFMLMWSLHVASNFMFKFFGSTFIFWNFLQNFIWNFMSEYFFPMFRPKFMPFHFLISFYKFCNMSFIFPTKFYTDLLYLKIMVQENLSWFFCVYIFCKQLWFGPHVIRLARLRIWNCILKVWEPGWHLELSLKSGGVFYSC